jgi:hypothetical protein
MNQEQIKTQMLRARIVNVVSDQARYKRPSLSAEALAVSLDLPISSVWEQVNDMVNAEILVYSEAQPKRMPGVRKKLKLSARTAGMMNVRIA